MRGVTSESCHFLMSMFSFRNTIFPLAEFISENDDGGPVRCEGGRGVRHEGGV